ncbi:NADH dehydrogenase [ubiquinone] 1 beta subcomplex subunit 3-like [Clavelina lepadiformis]|uniref:NADH dehydrogenase [ubiquinone] 1 beta subcomplex subunit 3 n=1 Tax=Clavelina lepadiformis TaxID=159417 RepID=A0ABP0F904_CLALP
MGVKWEDIPKKYKPHWSTWKIEGTPFEETQKKLNAKNLHDPWLRNEVWIYSIPKHYSSFVKVFTRGMIPGFALFLGLLGIKRYNGSETQHH